MRLHLAIATVRSWVADFREEERQPISSCIYSIVFQITTVLAVNRRRERRIQLASLRQLVRWLIRQCAQDLNLRRHSHSGCNIGLTQALWLRLILLSRINGDAPRA